MLTTSRGKVKRSVPELGLSERSQMYLDSNVTKNRECKMLSGIAVVSVTLLLILYEIGLFSPSKVQYVVGARTQRIEETTNNILASWGSAGEAIKWANLPSTGQGYLTVKAKVVQPDGTEQEEEIQIFYREASKLNPAGYGISDKIRHPLMKHIQRLGALSPLLKDPQSLSEFRKKADEDMDAHVISRDITLVFLHGQDYVSSTWEELGTLEYFAELGYRIYGIDMPGYGHSQSGVTVRCNSWLVDVIQKLLGSQDEEGNVDAGGGEHHTDSHEQREEEKEHGVVPSTSKVHKVAIVSPDVSGAYTLDLLYNHREKLGPKQHVELVRYIPISMSREHGASATDAASNTAPTTTDVPVCHIVGAEDADLDPAKRLFETSVEIEGGGKHVFLDVNPDVFHQIITTFLEESKCEIKDAN